MNNKLKNTVVVDCGKNNSTIFNGHKTKSLSHDEVLNLPCHLEKGTTIISEYAHLGVPRTLKSLSQPFTKNQLKSFYDNCEAREISLKLFPQKSTPRAIEYSRFEKSDETDPEAIYNLVQDFPQISLMNPPKDFEASESRHEGFKWKKEINLILNHSRSQDYEGEAYRWIIDNIQKIDNLLSDTSRSAFKIERYKVGNKNKGFQKGDININKLAKAQMCSVLATLMGGIDRDLLTEEAFINFKPRLRVSTGSFAGWNFVKRYVLCMTPFHLRGGVARSNIYYHGLKNWVRAQAKLEGVDLKKKQRGTFSKKEDEVFLKYRKQYCNSIKELFTVIKSILEDQ
jgi:hypothetical protein